MACSGTPWHVTVAGARRGRVSLKDVYTEGTSCRHTRLVMARGHSKAWDHPANVASAPVRGVMSNAKAGGVGGLGNLGAGGADCEGEGGSRWRRG